MRVVPEPFDGPDARALRDAQRDELIARYGRDAEPGTKPTAEDVLVFLVARDDDGTPLGCGGLRRLDDATAEIKRMYVPPQGRGRGVGASILQALEEQARAHGITALKLETGPQQPDAIRLYARHGYVRIPCWGAYAGEPDSLCMERSL